MTAGVTGGVGLDWLDRIELLNLFYCASLGWNPHDVIAHYGSLGTSGSHLRLGWLEAKIDADQGKIETKMKACLEAMEGHLEKMEATVKAGKEQMSQN